MLGVRVAGVGDVRAHSWNGVGVFGAVVVARMACAGARLAGLRQRRLTVDRASGADCADAVGAVGALESVQEARPGRDAAPGPRGAERTRGAVSRG